jgi:hypothetical protein
MKFDVLKWGMEILTFESEIDIQTLLGIYSLEVINRKKAVKIDIMKILAWFFKSIDPDSQNVKVEISAEKPKKILKCVTKSKIIDTIHE